jgi:hypothetical protein
MMRCITDRLVGKTFVIVFVPADFGGTGGIRQETRQPDVCAANRTIAAGRKTDAETRIGDGAWLDIDIDAARRIILNAVGDITTVDTPDRFAGVLGIKWIRHWPVHGTFTITEPGRAAANTARAPGALRFVSRRNTVGLDADICMTFIKQRICCTIGRCGTL